jgi:MOSC domain-containing protein YiiM
MLTAMRNLAAPELEAGLDVVRAAPADRGRLELIVCRPAVDEREELATAVLDTTVGLVGDTWSVRGSRSTPDGLAHPEKQITVISARVAALLARDPDRRALAGDQLYVDLDLGVANLPAGTRLLVGTAVIEVTAPQHRGCAKFAGRFGADALRFVDTVQGQAMRLRGLNAKVVTGGTARVGDEVVKIPGR